MKPKFPKYQFALNNSTLLLFNRNRCRFVLLWLLGTADSWGMDSNENWGHQSVWVRSVSCCLAVNNDTSGNAVQRVSSDRHQNLARARTGKSSQEIIVHSRFATSRDFVKSSNLKREVLKEEKLIGRERETAKDREREGGKKTNSLSLLSPLLRDSSL